MELHDSQRHILKSDKDKRAYIGGRVCGKTRLAAAAAIESAAEHPNTDILAPQQRMAMEIRDRVLTQLKQMDVSFTTKNKHIVEMESSGTMKFWSTQGASWKEGIRSSPSVIIDEAQALTDRDLGTILDKPNVLVTAQNHKRPHSLIDYESDAWEYAISPTTANPELNGAMLEEQWFDKPEKMFLADFLVRVTDLSNGHTLALPSKAYPFWEAKCLDCDFSRTLDVRDGLNGAVKKYVIGEALNQPCR